MQKEYHSNLKKVAKNTMKFICQVYGFTEFDGQYYNNYLLHSTSKNKDEFKHCALQINYLQNNFDVNLEPFKMTYKDVTEHLQANGYFVEINHINGKSRFNCFRKSYKNVTNGIIADADDFTTKKIKNEFENKEYDYISNLLQDFSIIAIRDLELSEFN